jgi:hypothetical protein
MSHEYPKAIREDIGALQATLAQAMGSAADVGFLAQVLGDMDARARDLTEITQRLLQPALPREELRELLLAFQLTSESLQTSADVLGGKLLDVVDSLEAKPAKALGA